MNTILLIMRNKARLEKMIQNDESWEKILKQSKKLDKYIVIQIKERELYKEKVSL